MLLVFYLIKGDLTISQINGAFFSIRNNEAIHVGCVNDEKERLLQLYLYSLSCYVFVK